MIGNRERTLIPVTLQTWSALESEKFWKFKDHDPQPLFSLCFEGGVAAKSTFFFSGTLNLMQSTQAVEGSKTVHISNHCFKNISRLPVS